MRTRLAVCAHQNSTDVVFLSAAPAAYDTSENGRCVADDIAMGALTIGTAQRHRHRLAADVLVTPDASRDMPGPTTARTHGVADGDAWLAQWISR